MDIDNNNDGTTPTTTTAMNIDNNDNPTDNTSSDTDEMLSMMMIKKLSINDVIVHPLVLLSVADHYHRVARGTRKRVIGILLGQTLPGSSSSSSSSSTNGSGSGSSSTNGGATIDITNSFALPFEEDSKNPAIFYLDHNYLESMYHMFRKVNAKERIVGFYSTGPQIRSNDLRIYDIVTRYTSGLHSSTTSSTGTKSAAAAATAASSLPTYPAIFSIIDVRPDRSDLPVTSYTVTEQINTLSNTNSSNSSSSSSSSNNNNKKQQQAIERIFVHVATTLGAVEAEEVGVEHLLRDIHDPTISTIASLIQEKVTGLQTLHTKLIECQQYIQSCIPNETATGTGQTVSTINPTIVSNLQTIISLLPNTIAITNQLHHTSMMQQTNDMYMSMYIAALLRTVMAIHDLINNQMKYGTDGTINGNDTTNVDENSSSTELKDGKLVTTNGKNSTTSNEEKKE